MKNILKGLCLAALSLFLISCGLNKSSSLMALSGKSMAGSQTIVTVKNSALTTNAMNILSKNCNSCHGSSSPGSGGFRSSDNPVLMVQQGFIVPGDPAGSMLIKRIVDNTMPPSGPLSAADVQTLKSWITTEFVVTVVASASGTAPSPTPIPVPLPSNIASSPALTILYNNCASCHGPNSSGAGGINYILDVNQLVANGMVKGGDPTNSPLYISMQNGTMPPAPAPKISTSDLTVIYNWILNDVKGSVPLAPTYSSIKANVLTPACVSCHNSTNAADGVRLDSYSAVLRYVVAGSPNQSKLYTIIQSGAMPPRSGIPVTSAELQAISGWISGGALNN